MSRVVGPLLSLSARKTFGKAMTFAVWKGINTVRLKSNPTNPQTVTQMTNRAYFAAGGKMAKATDPTETLTTYLKTVVPAEQSYISYLVSESMGAAYARIIATQVAYDDVGNSAIKAFFDDAAAQAGVQPVAIGSEAYENLTAGLVLAAAWAGAVAAGFSGVGSVFASLTEPNVFDFTEALTGVTPS